MYKPHDKGFAFEIASLKCATFTSVHTLFLIVHEHDAKLYQEMDMPTSLKGNN